MNTFCDLKKKKGPHLLLKFYILKKKIYQKSHKYEINIVVCSWWTYVHTDKNMDVFLKFYYL